MVRTVSQFSLAFSFGQRFKQHKEQLSSALKGRQMATDNGEKCFDKNIQDGGNDEKSKEEKLFTLKKWNAVAMWSWDVVSDTCAICRVQVMDACLRCQANSKQEECVVVWGECNHSFHNCCMSLWVVQNNRCPLCQKDWVVQRIGR